MNLWLLIIWFVVLEYATAKIVYAETLNTYHTRFYLVVNLNIFLLIKISFF